MLYKDFFSAKLHEIAAVPSFDDLVARIERAPFTASSRNMTPNHLAVLHLLLSERGPAQTPLLVPVVSHSSCFQLAPSFCQALRQHEHVQLLKIAAAWGTSAQWDNMDINAFDLAGFILALYQLCVYAENEHEDVFVLTSSKTDWQPNNT